MRISRFYIDAPLSCGQDLIPPAQLINYILKVLRLKNGDPLVLFNGREEPAGEYRATLTEVSKRSCTIHIDSFSPKNIDSPLQVHLFQGISRSERMDYTIQKAVELGISDITPVFTGRSNSGKLTDKRLEKKMQHWQGVALSACEQSGRTRLVTVHPPLQVDQLRQENIDIKLLLLPEADISMSQLADRRPLTVSIFIGPEGGLTDSEITLARDYGYQPVRLGPRILRTETAGLSILSVLQFLWGDLG